MTPKNKEHDWILVARYNENNELVSIYDCLKCDETRKIYRKF